jgi:O-methyltransferase
MINDTMRDKYISLLRKAILNELYPDHELIILELQKQAKKFGRSHPDFDFLHHIENRLPGKLEQLIKSREEGTFIDEGLKNLVFAHSMIGRKRMDNLEFCLREVIKNNIPGDVIECGVWKGGATIFMKGVLDAFGVEDRNVWVADSFEGLPEPSHPKTKVNVSKKKVPSLAISLEEVKRNFEKYELLDEKVCLLIGWFKDTLPNVATEQFSLIRLDGDLYESSMDALNALYHKLAPGGFLIVDDYGAIDECRLAVDEFRAANQIKEKIQHIDWTGVFWRKDF